MEQPFTRSRSRLGVCGTALLLSMIPIAVLYETLVGRSSDVLVHAILAFGALLLALGVLDFKRIPRWINVAALVMMGAESIIFALQMIGLMTQNAWLWHVAFEVLGQEIEGWLPRIFMVLWGGSLLKFDSEGKTRLLGMIVLTLFVVAETLRLGVFLNMELLKIAMLGPVFWILCESSKPGGRA